MMFIDCHNSCCSLPQLLVTAAGGGGGADGTVGVLCAVRGGRGQHGGLHTGPSGGRRQPAEGRVHLHGRDAGDGVHPQGEAAFFL